MHRQIHQNIHPLRRNCGCHSFVRHPGNAHPLMGLLANRLCHCIAALHIRKTNHFHLLTIMRLQQRQQEPPDRMHPQIRRHISNFQSSLRIATIVMHHFPIIELLELCAKSPQFLRQLHIAARRIEMQRVNQIALRLRMPRIQPPPPCDSSPPPPSISLAPNATPIFP